MAATDLERKNLLFPKNGLGLTAKALDWLVFAAVTAALSLAHILTAFAVGQLPTTNLLDGLLYYAGKGWLGPLAGVVYAGLHAAVIKPGRPGRAAWRAALVVGILGYFAALETRALLTF